MRESDEKPMLVPVSIELAVAVLRAVERGQIPTRSPVSDVLENWADTFFGVYDGTGIAKLREAADVGEEAFRRFKYRQAGKLPTSPVPASPGPRRQGEGT